MQILLVEDNIGDAYLIKDLLSRGAAPETQVTCVARLGDAKIAVRVQRYDVALVDLSLPDSTGTDSVQALAAEAPNLPVVVLTGTCSDQIAISAVQTGAQDFLVKGHVDEATLARSIRYAIERCRVQAELRKARDELQQRVEERTAELALAVQQLRAEIEERECIQESLRQAKEAADAANAAKSEFLAMMSHELRTPLNGVIGMTELLLGTTLDAQQRRFAWLVKSSGDALLSLINDILDFSKIEARKIELEYIDFDLRYAVESVAAAFASRAQAKGLELIAGVHPEVPALVVGDSGRLQQVLTNLAGNAIKFTESGEVIIRATLVEDGPDGCVVRFAVSDSGIGIAHDRQSRLFGLFSQVDASTTRRYGGTGLGLAICKKLVELMEGEIGVISEENSGSTFWFTIRLAKQPAESQRSHAALDDLRRMHVLVVDDNAANREILHEQLAAWGIAPATAESGEQALQMLKQAAETKAPFGLAILDMHMPGMDGISLARAIKTDLAIADTVLVLLTSLDNACEDRALRQVGFAGWLNKPARHSQLLETIIQAIVDADRPYDLAIPQENHQCLANPTRSRNARILLAEDHEIGREVAGGILARAGYAFQIVANGREALTAAMQGGFDLVLMDCRMPEMDGYAATQEIRKAEQEGKIRTGRKQRIPIIALTANAAKGDRERCLAAGMDDYISKPLVPDKLIAIIESHLSHLVGDPSRVPRTPSWQLDTPDETVPESPGQLHPSTQAAPGNLTALLKQCGGDRAFMRTLIEAFIKQAGVDISRLEGTLEAGDYKETARIAHSLKGAASFLCATGIRTVSGDLEALADAGDLHGFRARLPDLQLELDRYRQFTAAPVAVS